MQCNLEEVTTSLLCRQLFIASVVCGRLCLVDLLTYYVMNSISVTYCCCIYVICLQLCMSQLWMNLHLLTCTHTCTRFNGSLNFVRDKLGELVLHKTFTHSYLLWSSIIPYLLSPSIMIHGILSVQFTCLTVFFHNHSPSFLWSTSWPRTLHFILHIFFYPIIVFFCNTCPYHLKLFCYSTEIMSCIPSLYLNSLLWTLSCSLMPHIHLTILISPHWSATSFSFLMGQVSLPCNILFRTQLLYSLPLTQMLNYFTALLDFVRDYLGVPEPET